MTTVYLNMTTVYLHIGTPKTGTTSIQQLLSENRKKLLDQGVLYPMCGTSKKYAGHFNLAAVLMKERSNYFKNLYNHRAGNWEQLKEEIDTIKPKNVVISAENFFSLNFEDIALVKKYLSAFKVKVLVYLRKQDDFFVSMYIQSTKGRALNYLSFEEYYNKQLRMGSIGDYYRLLEPWEKIFGRENLIVRVWEPENFKNGLIGDFLECLNLQLDNSKLDFSKKSNISPNIKVVKIIRLLNKIFVQGLSMSREECQKLYLKYLLRRNKIYRIITKMPDWLISNELISDQKRTEIIKKFEESNRKVAQNYLGRQKYTLFSKARVATKTSNAPSRQGNP